jgi:EAL domain-containing protein (putative c-di-GMP-specific phosphodiesterase class I)
VPEAACRQLRAWQEALPACGGLSVSVNLSAKQFAQPDLSERAGRVLHAAGLAGHQLQLEITESAVMEHAGAATAVLAQLRALDVQLAVDDFGTSYSSLSYLKRFPLDTLKIDQAFVRGLGKDPDDTAIVQAIVSLAHTLGLQVTAEGVETTRACLQWGHAVGDNCVDGWCAPGGGRCADDTS